MLIIAPPSETKRPAPEQGPSIELEALAFPELTPVRQRLLDAVIATSDDLDAFARLGVSFNLAHQVARNTRLFEVPTLPVSDVSIGPVHEGLDVGGLTPAGRLRAEQDVVVTSPLWGLLRLGDRIPPYRLSLMSRLIGVDRLDHLWRGLLPDVLAGAAGPDDTVVDLRSPGYQAMGLPARADDRLVTVRVDHGPPGHRIGEVITKRTRGAAAHHLLEAGSQPRSPDDVAEILSARGPVQLEPSSRRGRGWTVTLTVAWG